MNYNISDKVVLVKSSVILYASNSVNYRDCEMRRSKPKIKSVCHIYYRTQLCYLKWV